jgi:hypothetical protein
MRLNSRSSSDFWMPAAVVAASFAVSSSLASSARSSRVSASEIARTWVSQPPTICSSCFLSRRRFCAFF